jgi:NitT/TauT family transport system substrate-binding protein
MFCKRLIVAVLLGVLMIACVPAVGPEDLTLKLAVLPILDALPIYVADAQGYFGDAGIKIEFVPVASAAEGDQVMQAGQVDGMINDLISTVLYNKDTQKIAVIRFERIAAPDYAQYSVLASKKSGITGVEGLKGVEIGISQGTVIEYLTQRVLEHAGLSVADIKTTHIPRMSDRMQMLAEGQLRAATLPEPFASLAVQSGAAVVISDATLPEVGTSEISFSVKTLKAKPETVKKFLAAIEKATADVNNNPDRWNRLLTDRKLVPAPLIGKFRLPKFPTASVPSEAQLKDVQAWMMDKGVTKAEVAYRKLVDASYLPR